ncbi:MAG: hypothetical protein ACR2FQ_12280 [Pseudonocardiaceae bacterium]
MGVFGGRVPAPRGWVVVTAAAVVLVAATVAGAVLRDPVVEASSSAVNRPTTTPTLVPGEQPGPRTVTFAAGAVDHPQREEVRALLQEYFDAINLGDYRRWTTTVVAERVATSPEQAWRDEYRTTTDRSIRMLRLEPRPGGGLLALLTLTSMQDPADAPPDAPLGCLRWRVTYSVVSESGELRLGRTEPGTSLHEPC